MALRLQHHDGSSAGIAWHDLSIAVVIVLALVVVGFVIFKVVQRRRLE